MPGTTALAEPTNPSGLRQLSSTRVHLIPLTKVPARYASLPTLDWDGVSEVLHNEF